MNVTTASKSIHNDIEVIPTGLGIDRITGIGGIPKKRITEIYGEPGVGKSSICLQIVAQAQKMGLKCLWADAEWVYSLPYAEHLGVDNDSLGLVQEEYAEAILDVLEAEIESGKWDLVVLDSVGGLLPRAEAEKGAEGKVIGGQAGLIARFCRKVVSKLVLKNVALIVINHSFTDIMSGKIKSSGGMKLEYHKSLSIRLKNKFGVVLKTGDKKVGKVIVAEVKKNKMAATEGQEVEMQLLFGTGFSATADLLQLALDRGVITKDGGWYFLGNEKLAYGMTKMREMMKQESFAEKIKSKINGN